MAKRNAAIEIRVLILVALGVLMLVCFCLSGLPRGGGGSSMTFPPPPRPFWTVRTVLAAVGLIAALLGSLGTLATIVIHKGAVWHVLHLYFVCAAVVAVGGNALCLVLALISAALGQDLLLFGVLAWTLPLALGVVIPWRLARRAMRERVWVVEQGGLEQVFE